MSASHTVHEVGNAPFQALLDYWQRTLDQNNAYAKAVLDSMRTNGGANNSRRLWLDSLGRCLDQYMRSPAFLEAMRRNFEAITAFKANAEEAAQEVAREAGVPRVNDIAGVFERVRIGQELILSRLDAIEEQLQCIRHAPSNGSVSR
jgi:hypothetical protein